MEQSNQATAKMNELADNFILARNIFVGSLAFYASVTLAKNLIVMPFIKTYRFLSNQTKNLEISLQLKYDEGICVILNSTTGMGPLYAKYLRTLGYTHLILIDKDDKALGIQKKELSYKAKDKPKIYTFKLDIAEHQEPEKA